MSEGFEGRKEGIYEGSSDLWAFLEALENFSGLEVTEH
jgi:hypothetical protein